MNSGGNQADLKQAVPLFLPTSTFTSTKSSITSSKFNKKRPAKFYGSGFTATQVRNRKQTPLFGTLGTAKPALAKKQKTDVLKEDDPIKMTETDAVKPVVKPSVFQTPAAPAKKPSQSAGSFILESIQPFQPPVAVRNCA